MKSNLKENIGFISIALVVALTLVLSVVAIDIYQNNDIVANAQVIDGIDYPSIPVTTYTSIFSASADFFAPGDGFSYFELFDGSSEFIPLPYNLYFIEVYDNDLPFYYIGYFYTSNNYYPFTNEDDTYSVVSSFSIASASTALQFRSIDCLLLYDHNNETYTIRTYDVTGDLDGSFVDVDIYLVPQAEDTSTTDSFLSLIGDGITFGFDSIASGITYTMDNLFIVDGELTNFSVVIFLMTGISLALAVLKFVFNFIFTFGGKN